MRWWLRRLSLAVLTPLFLFAAAEGLLRWTGYGVSARLYTAGAWDGRALVTENPVFTRPFFGRGLERAPWQTSFPAAKPPDEFRVFVLGESAALGDPIPEFGMARILEALLQERMPDRRVRVINAAITAINSHVIRGIAGEVARLEPDAVWIYMGNNEVVGPFGPGTVFPAVAARPWLVRLVIAVRGSRVGQAMSDLAARRRPAPFARWEGMEMFLERQVAPDDPRLATTRALFERNLEAICDTLRRRGVPVHVSTVAVNLRDCAPLASPPPEHEANRLFRAAKEADAAGRADDARRLYREAMEHDTLRFRADTAINDAIRRVAGRFDGRGVRLVDGEAIVAAASPDGVPGESMFYDHVHLTFAGQYRLARAAAQSIAGGEDDAWPDETAVAAALGWTAWSEHQALAEMYARRMRPPFSDQLDRGEIEQRWAGRLIEQQLALRGDGLATARAALVQALEKRGGRDSSDWKNVADIERRAGRPDAAALAYERLVEQLPHHAATYALARGAALCLLDADEGVASLDAYPAFRSWPVDRRCAALAGLLLEWEQVETATALYRKASEHNPDNVDALVNLAAGRAEAGDKKEAVAMLRRAVERRPGNDVAWANLGRALYEAGEQDEGLAALERAAQMSPGNAMTRATLAELYRRAGELVRARGHMDIALTQAPLDPAILADAARLAMAEQRVGDAAEWQVRAARLSPADAAIQYTAGQMLLLAGRDGEAVAFLRQTLALAPRQDEVRRNLAWLLAVHPDERVRDAAAAWELVDGLSGDGTPAWMRADLRAAARAAMGYPAEAAAMLEAAGVESVPAEFRDKIAARLALYREGRAYVAERQELLPRP